MNVGLLNGRIQKWYIFFLLSWRVIHLKVYFKDAAFICNSIMELWERVTHKKWPMKYLWKEWLIFPYIFILLFEVLSHKSEN